MRRILPLGHPPMVSTLSCVHPLSILAQSDAYLPWLYSRCIQLFHYPGETLRMLVHPSSARAPLACAERLSCPLLEVQSVPVTALRHLCADLVPAWSRLIADGYYVLMQAHHPLPGIREGSEARSGAVEMLLYGLDADARVFFAREVGAGGRPVAHELPFADLACAVRKPSPSPREEAPGGADAATSAARHGMRTIPRLVLFRYNEDARPQLDHVSVREQLEDYLNARNSSLCYRLDDAARDGGIWGMAVYGWLREVLERVRHQDPAFAPQAWQALKEHKGLMRNRLRFLERRGVLSPGTAGAYEHVAQLAHTGQRVLAEQSVRGDAGPRQAAAHLGRMAILEQRVLERAVRQLREAP